MPQGGNEPSPRESQDGRPLLVVHLDGPADVPTYRPTLGSRKRKKGDDAVGTRVAPDGTRIAVDLHTSTVRRGSDTAEDTG